MAHLQGPSDRPEELRWPRAPAPLPSSPQKEPTVKSVSTEERHGEVQDFMSRRVVTIDPEASLGRAFSLLSSLHASELLVVNHEEEVVGILDLEDIARVFARQAHIRRAGGCFEVFLAGPMKEIYLQTTKVDVAELLRLCFQALDALRVGDAMNTRPPVVAPEESLESAARTLEDPKVHSLPVVRDGHLVGILRPADMVAALSHRLARGAA